MADVKWIQLTTDMFDNAKIKYLRTLPSGNDLVLIWVMLLTKAGTCNANGFIFLTENIPYTADMLGAEFGFETNTINLALNTFSKLRMIQLQEQKICITNWEEYQNVDGLAKIREQTRKRVARYREKLALEESNVTCNVTVTHGNGTEEDKEVEEDIEKDKDKEVEENIKIEVDIIKEKWNSLGLNKLTSIKNKRLSHVKARIKEVGKEEFYKAIESINHSSFLKGENDRGWTINFDWFINPNNFIKVVEGNYLDKKSKSCKNKSKFFNFESHDYDYDDLEKKLLGWDDDEN